MPKVKQPMPIEVEVPNLLVSEFFDKRFVKMLEQEFKDAKFEHFCFYVKGPKSTKKEIGERVSIGHVSEKHEGKKLTNIHTSKPETLEKILKVVKSLY
jgi:hypothetical protein